MTEIAYLGSSTRARVRPLSRTRETQERVYDFSKALRLSAIFARCACEKYMYAEVLAAGAFSSLGSFAPFWMKSSANPRACERQRREEKAEPSLVGTA